MLLPDWTATFETRGPINSRKTTQLERHKGALALEERYSNVSIARYTNVMLPIFIQNALMSQGVTLIAYWQWLI